MIAEKHKQPGVCYALSDEGWELPIIDVTHPAFVCEPNPAQLAAASEISLKSMREALRLPCFVRRFFAQRSLLGRDFSKPYVGGMTSYFQKLGPENLGRGYAKTVDRRTARLIGPLAMRMRLQTMSRLLAERVLPALQQRSGAPLHLVNIGGGVAADSINALIILRKEHRYVLTNRPIRLHVLDLDPSSAAFSTRALAALRAPDAPLADLNVSLNAIIYDWLDIYPLRELLKEINFADAVIATSSEGGLFEYGTDAEILSNLHALHTRTPEDAIIVGSVLRDSATADPNLPLLKSVSQLAIRLLGLEKFRHLISDAGWTLSQSVDNNPFYHVVCLSKNDL